MNLDEINSTLNKIIPKSKSLLHEAAQYSLQNGKRIRPLLLLSVIKSVKAPIHHGLYAACAIEMIHTYSLIHDDLPCMDNDNLRRGKPTLHKVYTEAQALLVGDFLLTSAFETLSNAPDLTSNQKLSLIKNFSIASGGQGMVAGQLLDIQGSSDWRKIYEMKTGALIQCALVSGGIISGIDLDPLKRIGKTLGIIYQLVDDLLDADGTVLHFGHSWVENEISTMEELLKNQLDSYPGDPLPIFEVLSLMIHRNV